MSDVVDMLTMAKAKIISPSSWTTGVQARDADGNEVMPHWNGSVKSKPAAVAWSAAGAVMSLIGREYLPAFEALAKAAANEGCPGIDSYNDAHEHAEVLALFDKAIEAEQA
jgi:hypothetical protein